jgi:hypothetical protein
MLKNLRIIIFIIIIKLYENKGRICLKGKNVKGEERNIIYGI